MKIELQRVHLDKENKLSVSYKLTDHNNMAPVEAGPFTAFVHKDLIDAMTRLSVHAALMTGQLNPGDISDVENPAEILVQPFTAKSWSISGADNTQAIIISANRQLADKKVFNFNTPRYLLNANEESRYYAMDDVLKWVNRTKQEALAFLDGTKVGTDPQGNLFAQNETKPVTKLQIAEPVSKEWTAGEYLNEIADEPGAKKFIPNGVKADPEAQARVKEWEAAEGENKDRAKAVANQAGNKGRKKGGAKRVKQTADNRSGIIHDDENAVE
jgi:hypothetical protein